jgi:hypothetical protein
MISTDAFLVLPEREEAALLRDKASCLLQARQECVDSLIRYTLSAQEAFWVA